MNRKKIEIKGKIYKIPDRLIASAYAGACAAHQVTEHERMFGKKKVNWKDHFRYIYDKIFPNMKSIVKEIPYRVTLKEIVEKSPANLQYGDL
jgi:hypothetical protein